MDVVQHTIYASEAFFSISFRAMDLLTNYVPFVDVTNGTYFVLKRFSISAWTSRLGFRKKP